MTTEQTPHKSETREPANAIAEAIGEPAHADADLAGHGPVSSVVAAARTGLLTVSHGARRAAHSIPGTMRAARQGMRWTVGTLQTLPDSTLRSIAATSLGLGAGLSFTRAGRLAAVAGVVPAVVVEAAIAVRPAATAETRAAAE